MYLISVLGVVGLAVGVAVRDGLGGGFWIFQAAMLLVAATGLVGARLTVVVDARSVTASFGWGIRKVSRGWMYNNAGRNAVELSLRSGKVFRIGTDQPVELLAAITS